MVSFVVFVRAFVSGWVGGRLVVVWGVVAAAAGGVGGVGAGGGGVMGLAPGGVAGGGAGGAVRVPACGLCGDVGLTGGSGAGALSVWGYGYTTGHLRGLRHSSSGATVGGGLMAPPLFEGRAKLQRTRVYSRHCIFIPPQKASFQRA